MKNFSVVGLLILLVSMQSCVKKPDPVVETPKGTFKVTVENMAGNELMVLNDKWYKNENGDSVKFTIFNYFLSNVKLTKEDGSVYAVPESYFLLKQSDASSKSFVLNDIPPGTYVSMSFLIGVDSTRNVSGAQTGALDQASGMFWDWNTGYVMAKMEGLSPQATQFNGNIVYHLGGFSGANSVLRTVHLGIGKTAIAEGQSKTIHIKADALEWFKTPNLIKIKDLSLLSGTASQAIADNYVDMFSIDHID